MSVRPRLLDLFCGAGGAAMGYSRAGFEVVGVDIKPQPRYPFEFWQRDALEVLREGALIREDEDSYGGWALYDFAAIHASPPCQFATSLRSLHKDRDYENLIPATRELLDETGLPYVIENVELARKHMVDPVLICGSMFDPPMDVRRHRYFEANWPLEPPMWPCRHNLWDYRYRSLDKRKRRGTRVVQAHSGGSAIPLSRTVGVHGNANYAGETEIRKRAMGIDWMTQRELAQAIPPSYTELIGHQLMQHVLAGAAA